MSKPVPELTAEWEARGRDLRDPAAIVAQWDEAGEDDGTILRYRASPGWWGLLQDLGICLLVTREYEHLLLALSAHKGKPRLSYLRIPHPSGLVANKERVEVTVAATRNPNQVVTLRPANSSDGDDPVLLPARTEFYPGASYLHDLAFVGEELLANSTSQNAVVSLRGGIARRVWWPRSLDALGESAFSVNSLQLNSIAAGANVEESFFTASAAAPIRRRPGHLDFPIDGRGVVFSGRTRDVVAGGLTRPHSARLHQGRLWVANSGYGEVGVIDGARFEPVARLPGWTRGLALIGNVALVGTSRVIPRYRRYAPGVAKEKCGVYALDIQTGAVKAWLTWPTGNQIFAIDWIASTTAVGLPFRPGARATRRRRAAALFFNYRFLESQ